jgi:hypothetical protein
MSNARLVRAGAAATSWHNTPDTGQVWTSRGPESILRRAGEDAAAADVWVEKVRVTDPRYGLIIEASKLLPDPPNPEAPRGGTLIDPRFTFRAEAGDGKVKTLGEFRADRAAWHVGEDGRGYWRLEEGRLALRSDLTPQDLVLRRTRRWLQYMSISQLTDLLKLPHVPNREAARLTRHIRVTEPVNNLVMLLLGLPFILSRERNIKAAAGLCLLLVLTFYAFVHMCRNISGLPPEWAAWLPILLFGPVAVVMFDSVKT